MSITGFRLYLDAHYEARDWPFSFSWEEAAVRLPENLPGGVRDFDLFLPDDCDNGAYSEIERQHAQAGTEMAVYRDGSAVVVVLRMQDAPPISPRYGTDGEDGAMVWVMADGPVDELLYMGINPRSAWTALRMGSIRADRSGDSPTLRVTKDGAAAAAHRYEFGWNAVLRFEVAAVPGADAATSKLRFSPARMVGSTRETIGWTAAPVWFPMLNGLGTLHLAPRLDKGPRLYRADLWYDAADEAGELELTLEATNGPVPVQIMVNTIETNIVAAGACRHRIVPENGRNAITVKVGDARSVAFGLEKWSGHELYPRYAASGPLPTMDELRAWFRAAHIGQERGYCGEGVWAHSVAREAEEQPVPTGSEGLDHHCAFVAIPYALACLALERDEVYLARVHEACRRMLRCEREGGLFRPQPIAAGSNPWDNGAFTQGSVGEALLLGYRIFGDEVLLGAAQRAAAAYDGYGLDCNTNYAAFALWHLAELHELTGDSDPLERALWYAELGIIRGMNPSGGHPGHNYYSTYGDITLKGMAKLLRVLPVDHRFRPVLRERVIRYANQMLSRQCQNGLFEGYNRLYRGYQHPVNGFFDLARALPEFGAVLEPVFINMLNAHPRTIGAGSPVGIKEIALMGRYVGEKNRLG